MRKQRRIRGHHHDDRAIFTLAERFCRAVRGILWDLPAHWYSRNAQVRPSPKIALHQHADGVPALFRGQLSRRCANPAFEFVAYHSRAAANVTFLDGSRRSGLNGMERMFRLHVEAIDIIQPSVPRLRDNGK